MDALPKGGIETLDECRINHAFALCPLDETFNQVFMHPLTMFACALLPIAANGFFDMPSPSREPVLPHSSANLVAIALMVLYKYSVYVINAITVVDCDNQKPTGSLES